MLVTHSASHPRPLDLIREEFADFEVREFEFETSGLDVTDDRLLEAVRDCEVLLHRPGVLGREVIEAAEELRVIALTGSGYDHVDLDAATERGIVVVNLPENPAPNVVEHVFGFAVALLRDFPTKFVAAAEGRWDEARQPVTALRTTTVGVLGVGTIGFPVAKIAHEAFGARVVAYDPYVTGDRESPIYPRHERETVEAAGVELLDRAAFFEEADLVTVHVPHTEETHHIVGADELAALEGGYLINTSRGGVVDEQALVDAVDRGSLAGVALDVTNPEPPAPDNPLLGAENVVLTPHVSGISTDFQERAVRLVRPKIEAVLDGERPPGVVNPAVYE
jgi:D-3-phosphoglycerate dehydrogenase